MNAVMPCFFNEGPVEAADNRDFAYTSPGDESLCLLIIQSSPSLTARVRKLGASEPLPPGSVSPHAPSVVPLAGLGR